MKALFTLFLSSVLLFATDLSVIKSKIVERTASAFLGGKKMRVYTDDPSFRGIFNGRYHCASEAPSCIDANIIISPRLEKFKKICPPGNERIYFATRYDDYMKNREIAAGAIFWQKGRLNIILNARMVKKMKIKLPAEFEKYVE